MSNDRLCNCLETVDHIFWECPKIKPVVLWVSILFKQFCGTVLQLNSTLFLYGFPEVKLNRAVFNRMWYVFCVAKFFIWKSRCLHVFEAELNTADVIVSRIKSHISDRVNADRLRFSEEKFRRIWVCGRSFVYLNNNKVVLKLP